MDTRIWPGVDASGKIQEPLVHVENQEAAQRSSFSKAQILLLVLGVLGLSAYIRFASFITHRKVKEREMEVEREKEIEKECRTRNRKRKTTKSPL